MATVAPIPLVETKSSVPSAAPTASALDEAVPDQWQSEAQQHHRRLHFLDDGLDGRFIWELLRENNARICGSLAFRALFIVGLAAADASYSRHTAAVLPVWALFLAWTLVWLAAARLRPVSFAALGGSVMGAFAVGAGAVATAVVDGTVGSGYCLAAVMSAVRCADASFVVWACASSSGARARWLSRFSPLVSNLV